jgi:hypothetical protein
MKGLVILLSLCFAQTGLYAQFAPQAGVNGSTAIHKGSSKFTGWATGCDLKRGYKDIADPSQGYTTTGDYTMALGKPDITIVSLGDSGVATLTFSHEIYNGEGPDFAVFENGFQNAANPEEAFLEFAFVEVSSDGVSFTRFPATSNIPTSPQTPMAGTYMNARYVNNLAGKYMANYGTPFDLEELKNTPGLDVDHITHVRIIDVIGDVGAHSSTDKDGKIINDPYPTAIPGGGFDLDAVGAFYQHGLFPSGISNMADIITGLYPNPAINNVTLSLKDAAGIDLAVTDVTGQLLLQPFAATEKNEINIATYKPGIYYLVLSDSKGNKWVERITKL